MNEIAYWIWLLKTLGPAAPIADILSYFGSPQKLYEAGSTEWKLSGIMTAKQITALTRFSPSESGKEMHQCMENGWQIITPDSLYYPQELLKLRNFPPVLFLWGSAEALARPVKISMVGTRKASRYGLRIAHVLSEVLAKSGVTIVSGGALGVDSASHIGALKAGGTTIAVLGCGFGTDYLKENAPMRAAIAKSGGAVVSEFLPFSPASRTTFPVRNRIIAALSIGTVVVEAGERSGSLITARCAIEQGKDVFAVPGDLISTAYTGANKLIKEGAKPVFSPMDVLEEYQYLYPNFLDVTEAKKSFGTLLREDKSTAVTESRPEKPKPSTRQNRKEKPLKEKTEKAPIKMPSAAPKTPAITGVSPLAKTIYEALSKEPKHIDDLCEVLSLPVQKVLSALTELELLGYVTLQEGKKYQITAASH